MSPIISNRRAKREYEILETVEAGIILSGPEVQGLLKLISLHFLFD